MAESIEIKGHTKDEQYTSLVAQIRALCEGEKDLIANLANISSALKYGMNFFWVGFYLVKENELVLGPFQGTVACTRIAYGKGVCGTSWKNKEVIIVEDVDQFPGHIACSSQSKSEIVLPVFNAKNEVIAVLDIDDDKYATFDQTDAKHLKDLIRFVETLF
jgi:L-methionine (R)-S-oxide reductase